MGYYSQVTGRIDIDPEISHKTMVELISKGFSEDESNKYSCNRDALVGYDTIVKDTDEGMLTAYLGHSIIPMTDDSYKAYDILKHVQDIVDFLGTDYTFSGYLQINGEEKDDLWRIVIKDGKAAEVKPQIAWPD